MAPVGDTQAAHPTALPAAGSSATWVTGAAPGHTSRHVGALGRPVGTTATAKPVAWVKVADLKGDHDQHPGHASDARGTDAWNHRFARTVR